jgi:hypothetical protein
LRKRDIVGKIRLVLHGGIFGKYYILVMTINDCMSKKATIAAAKKRIAKNKKGATKHYNSAMRHKKLASKKKR